MNRLIILFAFYSIGLSDSIACDCIPSLSLEEHYKQADIVFLAEIIEIQDTKIENFKSTLHYAIDSLYILKGGYSPILKITRTFKGEFKNPLIDNKYGYKTQWSMCEVFFRINQSYVVFGYFDENGIIITSICSPTKIATTHLLNELEELK